MINMLRSSWVLRPLVLLFLAAHVASLYLKTNDQVSLQKRDVQNASESLGRLNPSNDVFEAIVAARIYELEDVWPNPIVLNRVSAMPLLGPQWWPEAFTRISIEFFDRKSLIHYTTINTVADPHQWYHPEESEEQSWGENVAWRWSERRSTIAMQVDFLRKAGQRGNFLRVSVQRLRNELNPSIRQLYWSWKREHALAGEDQNIWQGDSDHQIYQKKVMDTDGSGSDASLFAPYEGNVTELPQTSKRDSVSLPNGTVKADPGPSDQPFDLRQLIIERIGYLMRTWPRKLQLQFIRVTPLNGVAANDPYAFVDIILYFYDQRPGFAVSTSYYGSTTNEWTEPVEYKCQLVPDGVSLWNGTEQTSTITEQMAWLRRQGVYGRASKLVIAKNGDEIVWTWEFTAPEVPGTRWVPALVIQLDELHRVVEMRPIERQDLRAIEMVMPNLNASALDVGPKVGIS